MTPIPILIPVIGYQISQRGLMADKWAPNHDSAAYTQVGN